MDSSRLLPFVTAPEVCWGLLLLAVHVACRVNVPATEAGSDLLCRCLMLLPFTVVPLSFLCLFVPHAGRWTLLLRLDVAALVGVTWAAVMLSNAIDYRDSRNSGVGTGLLITLILSYLFLGIGTLVTVIVYFVKRAPPSS